MSLLLLFGALMSLCHEACLHGSPDAAVQSSSVAVLYLLHCHQPREHCDTLPIFLMCRVGCMPISEHFRGLQTLPARVEVKSHAELCFVHLSCSQITPYGVLARSGHRNWYRKQQLSGSSAEAETIKSVLYQKNPLHCRGRDWALHPARKKPPMNAKVCRAAADVCDLEI